MNFGGDTLYFIDKFDGQNTKSDLSYQQKVENKKLDVKDQGNDTIVYTKTIVAKGRSSINSAIINFAPTIELEGSKLDAKFLTINNENNVKLQNSSNAKVANLVFQGLNGEQEKITKDATSNFNITESLVFDKTTNFDIVNSSIDNLDSLNIIAKNKSAIKSGADVTLKNITLNDSTYSTGKTLSLTNSNVVLKNNSTLSVDSLNLTNMKNANFNIQSSNIKAKNLTTDNSTLDLKSLNLKGLESIEAKGLSTLSLNTWDTDKIDKVTTDENSKFVFDDLNFNLSNDSKTVSANVKLTSSLTLKNIDLAADTGADEFKLNTLKFEKTLTFADALKIDISFADALKNKMANIDYDKEYEILTATRIVSEGTPYIKFNEGKGVYATSLLSGNAIKIKFTKEDPTSLSSLSRLSNNANTTSF
ncbi:hypothetical protein [Campylobacter californiensis]|uniref:hypothetical protein n=1 Tax=Campylobacter californiensis TaxID=1032243 RepID=UPI0014739AB8|nr:hypothetical protein [Campylobacter sp. RM12916]MBE3609969.1 hypothetical protein [Campylobacter sp. RM12916]